MSASVFLLRRSYGGESSSPAPSWCNRLRATVPGGGACLGGGGLELLVDGAVEVDEHDVEDTVNVFVISVSLLREFSILVEPTW